jgi:hypothetical protein
MTITAHITFSAEDRQVHRPVPTGLTAYANGPTSEKA